MPFQKGNKLCPCPFTKGHTPYNKGTKGISKSNSGSFKKGHKIGHRFKKGNIPWNAGLKGCSGQISPMKGKKMTDEHYNNWLSSVLKNANDRNARTSIEAFIEEQLIVNKLNYRFRERIANDRNTFYELDFIIDNKINLEVDGTYFHEKTLRERNDPEYYNKRDAFVESTGLRVFRISDKNLVSGFNDFLKFYKNA